MRTIITMAGFSLIIMVVIKVGMFLSPYAEALLEVLPSFYGRNFLLFLLFFIFCMFIAFLLVGGTYWLLLEAYERITGKRF